MAVTAAAADRDDLVAATERAAGADADAAAVLRALRRVRRAASPVQQIVYDRLFDNAAPPSAQHLAEQRGVSYEAVRKVASKLRRRINAAAEEPLGRLAADVSAQLGDAAAAGSAADTAATWFPESRRHRVLACRLLVERLDYRTVAGFDLSPRAAAAAAACREAARRGDVGGVLDAARLDGHPLDAVMEVAGIEVRLGLIWRRGTPHAAIAATFERLGSPLSTNDLIDATGLTSVQLRAALTTNRHAMFARDGHRMWALATDDEAGYSSIGDEIRRLVERSGGAADEQDLIAEVASRRAVSPGSVRQILRQAPAFAVADGTVSLRPLSLRPLPPSVVGGEARHRFRCERKHLRGYSVSVPAVFAAALGVGPGGRAVVAVESPAGVAALSLIWSAGSNRGPELGRLREALTALGACPGDAVTVAASDGKVCFDPPVQPPPADAGVSGRRRPRLRVCAYKQCGREFQPAVDSARYCSPRCRRAAGWATRKPRYRQRHDGKSVYARPTRVCANELCGRGFHPTTSQNTCSNECRKLYRAQQRKRGPIRRCAGCAGYYRAREGHKNCCTPECYESVEAGMNWDLLSRGCLLGVLVLLIDECAGGGYATSESISSRLGVSRSSALRHLAALEQAGLAARRMPVSPQPGSLPHEFTATVPSSAVAALAPSVDARAVEALASARARPPQIGSDLWILATLARLLPGGQGIVRRADVAAVIGRHPDTVSRSVRRLQAAGLLTCEAVPSVAAGGEGTGGGLRVTLNAASGASPPNANARPNSGHTTSATTSKHGTPSSTAAPASSQKPASPLVSTTAGPASATTRRSTPSTPPPSNSPSLSP